ncbi:MAG: YjbQ family protein [Ignisphaera sp.]
MYSKVIEVKTYGPMVLHNITDIVTDCIKESGVKNGLIWISVEGATPAIVVLEVGKEEAFLNFITRLIPFEGWRHGNAYAHLISTILSTNAVIPVENGAIMLRNDERIYLLETRSVYNHVRRIAVEIHGI